MSDQNKKPNDTEKLISEIELALQDRAQFLVANDPQCCQLQGALDYANGKYQLKTENERTNGSS